MMDQAGGSVAKESKATGPLARTAFFNLAFGWPAHEDEAAARVRAFCDRDAPGEALRPVEDEARSLLAALRVERVVRGGSDGALLPYLCIAVRHRSPAGLVEVLRVLCDKDGVVLDEARITPEALAPFLRPWTLMG
jgi:hypothetical protein